MMYVVSVSLFSALFDPVSCVFALVFALCSQSLSLANTNTNNQRQVAAIRGRVGTLPTAQVTPQGGKRNVRFFDGSGDEGEDSRVKYC